MKYNQSHLPTVRQHSAVFRYIARPAGTLVMYGLRFCYSLMAKKDRGPRSRALITWNDQVLLVKNVADHDRWTLPGGGPKAGENFAEALARELDEELSIKQSLYRLQPIKHFDKTEVGEDYDKVCFLLDLSSDQPASIVLSIELIEARWFPIAQLPDQLSAVVRLALRDK